MQSQAPELPSPTRGSLAGAAARSSASSCRGVPASRALADLATLLATVLAFPFPCPSAQSCARGPQGPPPSPTRHRGQGQAASPSSTSGSAPATLSAAGGWRQRPSVPARWPGAQWSPVRSCAIPAGPWRPGPGPLPPPPRSLFQVRWESRAFWVRTSGVAAAGGRRSGRAWAGHGSELRVAGARRALLWGPPQRPGTGRLPQPGQLPPPAAPLNLLTRHWAAGPCAWCWPRPAAQPGAVV